MGSRGGVSGLYMYPTSAHFSQPAARKEVSVQNRLNVGRMALCMIRFLGKKHKAKTYLCSDVGQMRDIAPGDEGRCQGIVREPPLTLGIETEKQSKITGRMLDIDEQ